MDSAPLSWDGGRLVGYRYAGSDVEVPPLRDYLLVAYRDGATPMHRRCAGDWQTDQMRPGSISFLSHAQPSHWRWSETVEVLHLYLSPATVIRTATDLYEREIEAVHLRDVLRADDPLLAGLVAGLAQEAGHGGLGGSFYAETLTQAACVHLLRHYTEVQFRETEARGCLPSAQCRRLISFVEHNLDGAITLADLAGVVGLSVFHFTRMFRGAFGCPPHVYVMRQRVEGAKRRLARPEVPLKVVAAECGFADQSHMTRVFRNLLGVTPGDYRRQVAG
ncbi:AraC family transcriptional regulator [Methylobacterium sp. NEAU 140]|uniref:AraC family transcriptional regulator n=1 Tax=Methylobacterium sp. NEAU 140 TaxID=3064945 RepID=UPI0027362AC5|nr:AraC family transcriptional regulator [Methylobacterium sp. NEAU 140]MDP4027099.1 AraC family transcriptional regulator [Methylobacterium sp. NEAU 140]